MGTFKNEPYLIDKPIGEIQDYIRDAIPWLDNIFGRVQILVRDAGDCPILSLIQEARWVSRLYP